MRGKREEYLSFLIQFNRIEKDFILFAVIDWLFLPIVIAEKSHGYLWHRQ